MDGNSIPTLFLIASQSWENCGARGFNWVDLEWQAGFFYKVKEPKGNDKLWEVMAEQKSSQNDNEQDMV